MPDGVDPPNRSQPHEMRQGSAIKGGPDEGEHDMAGDHSADERRALSSLLLLIALFLLLGGVSWAWVLGFAIIGIVIRPGMPTVLLLLGAFFGFSCGN